MIRACLIAIFLVFTSHLNTSVAGIPFEGTYVGFMKINGKTKYPVTLEILRRDIVDGDKSDLLAFLKVLLGGFRSHEYISQFYVVSDYKWDNNAIALDGNKQGNGPDLSLDGVVLENGKIITAKVRTSREKAVEGEISLRYLEDESASLALNSIYPELPVVSPITGQYEGFCSRLGDLILQLEATKEHSWELPTLRPFAGYRVSGRVGMQARGWHFFNLEGDFNHYTGKIKLPALGESGRECTVSSSGISCTSDCIFERKEKDNFLSKLLVESSLKQNKKKFSAGSALEASPLTYPYRQDEIGPEYFGFLHLKERDAYELMSVEPMLTELGKKFSIVSKVYVGAGYGTDPIVSLTYNTDSIPGSFDNHVLMAAAGDSIMKIDSWNRAGVRGMLYSKAYGGRVGAFELIKGSYDTMINHPAFASFPTAKALRGIYKGKWDDEARVSIDIDTQVSDRLLQPPYFPFLIGGLVTLELPHTDVHGLVSSGFYDPFTGTLTLRMDTGATLMGRLTDAGIVGFYSTGDCLAAPFREQAVQLFRRMSE
ncbi:MAG: hypothetical protein HY537_08115 [Deltaproteobacteria bacterium]|nr:hypothetical protein [Deltaproteobacteria bacterium]